MSLNLDNLFSQINDLQQSTHQKPKEKNQNSNKEFKNIESVFLDGILGSTELKLIIGNDNFISTPIEYCSVKDSKGNKIATVVLKTQPSLDGKTPASVEGCEVRSLVKKIDESKLYGNSWKLRPIKTNKILVKTGESVAPGLKPNTMYIAYVGDKMLNVLMKTLADSRKYYESTIMSMLDVESNKGGLLVTVAKSGKTKTFNAQFIPELVFTPTKVDEVFGSKGMMTTSAHGIFRANYVNKDKYDSALRYLRSLHLRITTSKDEKSDEKSTTNDTNSNSTNSIPDSDEPISNEYDESEVVESTSINPDLETIEDSEFDEDEPF